MSLAVMTAVQPVSALNVEHLTANPFPGRAFAHSFNGVENHPSQARVAARSDEDILFVPEITFAPGGDISMIFAVAKDASGEVTVYPADIFENFQMRMPAGTYDMIALGYDNRLQGTVVLVKEDVAVDASTTLRFDLTEATHRTDIRYIAPSGDEFTLPDSKGEGGNCSTGQSLNMVTCGGKLLGVSTVWLVEDGQNYVLSNGDLGDFRFTLLAYRTAKEGMSSMVIPVDVTKDAVGTDASGWQTAQCRFQPTPLNIRRDEVSKDLGLSDHDAYYTAGSFAIAFNGRFYGSGSMGCYGSGYDGAKVCLWAPADYDNEFEFLAYPMGDVFRSDFSGVRARAIRRTADGPVQLGLNCVFKEDLYHSADHYGFERANPALTGKPTDALLANCAPAFVAYSLDEVTLYNFVGRHGEAMDIDSWDIWTSLASEDEYELFGGQTSSVSVMHDGKLVEDNRNNYPWDMDWEQSGRYEITYSTDNIMIDGQVPGQTTAVVSFDAATFDYKLPTVTNLSIVNGTSGEITDRFSSVADKPVLSLYAAQLWNIFDSVNMYGYYDVATPSSVTAEWAPAGSGDFTAIEMKNIPERFFAPGYGAYYEGDLEGVSVKSPGGWYDLRVTVEDANGSRQQQIISPAFNIADLAGVESVAVDTNDTESPAVYYNLQGQTVTHPQPGQLLICRRGDRLTKTIVR